MKFPRLCLDKRTLYARPRRRRHDPGLLAQQREWNVEVGILGTE